MEGSTPTVVAALPWPWQRQGRRITFETIRDAYNKRITRRYQYTSIRADRAGSKYEAILFSDLIQQGDNAMENIYPYI